MTAVLEAEAEAGAGAAAALSRGRGCALLVTPCSGALMMVASAARTLSKDTARVPLLEAALDAV